MTVGIVLAGGRSSRFGRDKLAEPLADGPLLWRPIRALVAAGCREVVVVLDPAGASPVPPPELDLGTVRLVRDETAYEGPLAGLATGLRAIAAGTGDDPVVLVAGGDQPGLAPALLAMLGGRVGAGSTCAILVDPTGRARPLPMAVRARDGLDAADRVLARGARRLRDLPAEVPTAEIGPSAWIPLDPTGASLRDVDVPADLDRSASDDEDEPPAGP